MRIPIVIIAVVSVLAGCTALFGADRNADERFVRPEQPQTSPSGEFVAHAELGPEQNYVQQGAGGAWSKEYPRPGHYDDDVPPEIRELSGR